MKRTAFTSYACKEKITIEDTPYKNSDGYRIWTDGTNYYNLQNSGRHFCRRSVTWVAQKLVDDIITNAEKYGTYIG